jgi:hypothetical protein
MEDKLEKLERLSRLFKDGMLTQAEFEQQKALLLGGVQSPKAPPPVPKTVIAQGSKSDGTARAIIIGILVSIVLLAIGNFIFSDSGPKTKQELRAEDVSRLFSGFDGSHAELEAVIKSDMNDPESYEHVETRYRDDGSTIYVITTFRGKNAFGGTVTHKAEATLGGSSGKIMKWKLLN